MRRGLAAGFCLLVIWQGITVLSGLPAFILPAPVAVGRAMAGNAGLLAGHGITTLAEVLAGLALGAALGITLAIGLHVFPVLRRGVEPVLAASQAVPVFVLAPLLTIWLGYGMGPKVAMTVLLVFFPVFGSLFDAMEALPERDLDLARIAGAPAWRTALFLRLPHAAGGLRSGLRIGASFAPTGAVIGEWVGASKGLGYLMLVSNARSRTDLMFAALAAVIALTLACRWLVDRIFRLCAGGGRSRL